MGGTNNQLLANLVEGDGSGILAKAIETVTLSAGEVLCSAGDPIRVVYFPESALVSVATVMRSGDRVESGLVGPEGGIGVVERAGSGLMLSEAVCVVGGEAKAVSGQAFQAAVEASEAVRRRAGDYGELLVVDARQSLACTARHSARDRLAWWLLECHERLGGAAEMPIVQAFMASRLGVQRTTISTLAGELEAVGAIQTIRGRVRVLDAEKLRREACECYLTLKDARAAIERVEA